MSLRAREGLPDHTRSMLPSELHAHLHRDAYCEMEAKFAAADATRAATLEAARATGVNRGRQVAAMLSRVDQLRAGKTVEMPDPRASAQALLDSLHAQGLFTEEKYASESRRVAASEARDAARAHHATLRASHPARTSAHRATREAEVRDAGLKGPQRFYATSLHGRQHEGGDQGVEHHSRYTKTDLTGLHKKLISTSTLSVAARTKPT